MFDPAHPHPEYRLTWPRLLLEQELLAARDGEHPYTDAGLVLAEAFVGRQPVADLRRLGDERKQQGGYRSWGEDETLHDAARRFVDELLTHTDAFPLPRQYWAQRHDLLPPTMSSRLSEHLDLQNSWLALVSGLVENGYLGRAAGDDCDKRGGSEARDRRIGQLVTERAGLPPQSWPGLGRLYSTALSEDSFYTLVEIMHDLVARPRSRQIDTRCLDYHPTGFFPDAGQVLYRFKVNDLLTRYGIELQVADTGEDQGLLVHLPDDPRRDLVEQVRVGVLDDNIDRIGHAVALYRSRHAGAADKRRACRELADVLESRRKTVLEAHLVKGDEGSLFDVANRFAIRHHRDDQMYGYDEAFLDWIFWWYLATVELTNRLIARDEAAGG